VDVDDVDSRVFAVGVGCRWPQRRSPALTTGMDRAWWPELQGGCNACPAVAPALAEVAGGARHLGCPRVPSLIAPLTFPTSRPAVSSLLSYSPRRQARDRNRPRQRHVQHVKPQRPRDV